MTRAKRTQIDRLFNRLRTGKNLTVAEAKKKFGVQRLSARVFELTKQGYKIYTNKVNVKGRQVTAYRLDINSID